VHPIYIKTKNGCHGNVSSVLDIGSICILSADHSNPLHNQLPSRYRSHKAIVTAICVPKLVAMATSFTTSGPHLTHDSLGPSEPTTQTGSQTIQQFSKDDRRASLHFTMGHPFSLKIAPSHEGSWTSSNTWFSLNTAAFITLVYKQDMRGMKRAVSNESQLSRNRLGFAA